MDNTASLVVDQRTATRRAVDNFSMSAYHEDCGHNFQVFIDCGGDPGPWVAVGINDTVYTIGWLPERYRGR